jgi:hypothetical protein
MFKKPKQRDIRAFGRCKAQSDFTDDIALHPKASRDVVCKAAQEREPNKGLASGVLIKGDTHDGSEMIALVGSETRFRFRRRDGDGFFSELVRDLALFIKLTRKAL